MANRAQLPWTVAAFLAWQKRQPDRYELVGGRAVRMMAGARNVHNDIVVNLLSELRRRLRGGPCRPSTGDRATATLPGRIRRTDADIGIAPSTFHAGVSFPPGPRPVRLGVAAGG